MKPKALNDPPTAVKPGERNLRKKKSREKKREFRKQLKDEESLRKHHQELVTAESTKDDDDKALEKLVFGGSDDFVEKLSSKEPKKRKERKAKTAESESDDEHGKSESEPMEVAATQTPKLSAPEPVWSDDDDNDEKVKVGKGEFYGKYKEKKVQAADYKDTLKTAYTKLVGTPAWARLKHERESEGESDDDDDLTHSTGNITEKATSLPPNNLQLRRCPDANRSVLDKGVVVASEFHPAARVLLTASTFRRLNLFQIDGAQNPKIQSVHLKAFEPIEAHFAPDGLQIMLTGRHKGFLYYYDLEAAKLVQVPRVGDIVRGTLGVFRISPDGQWAAFLGPDGFISLLSVRSHEWIDRLKLSGSADALTFSPDGRKLFVHGDEGQVHVFDMNSRQCVQKFVDDGCLRGVAVALSPDGQYLATGCVSGIVNLYQTPELDQSPKPLRVFRNLRSAADLLKFNSQSELLAMASSAYGKAIKLAHVGARSVYPEFPRFRLDDYMNTVHCVDFSPNSGFLTIGNNCGKALLYRLKHYEDF